MQFRCPGSCRCGTICSVEDHLAGCTIACPNSGERIRVPDKEFAANDWDHSTDPQEMLMGLPSTVQNRKLRLFALACCQRIEGRLTHPLSREALLLAERYVNGLATDEEMRALSQRFMDEYNTRLGAAGGNWDAMNTTDIDAAYDLALKAFPTSAASRVVQTTTNQANERAVQCQLLRCIFGNPLRPVKATTEWFAHTVASLAQSIRDESAFDRMPILADALEDAGCTNSDILKHCRQPGKHVRNCWVIELLLSKYSPTGASE